MTQEKAKAYEEAYKRVAIRFGTNVADELFPELCESEDEKTRKEIVGYLKKNLRLEWATWLEKQGQKEPIIMKDTLDVCNDLGLTPEEYSDVINKTLFGEQKPQRMVSAEAKEAMYDKSKWSEEDEEDFDIAIKTLCESGRSSFAEWLKSLKERMVG